MNTLLDKLPSADTALKSADTATTWVCYYAIYKRLPSTIGVVVFTFVVMYLVSGAEDRMDLTGEVEEVVDSGVLEEQVITDVQASRVAHRGNVVENSQTTVCKNVQRQKPDGSTYTTRRCTCDGLDVRYVDTDGSEQVHRCAPVPGTCAGNRAIKYVVEQDGRKVCQTGVPKVRCTINHSVNAKAFPLECPKVGSSIELVKTTNNTIMIPDGNWNTVTLKIRFMDDMGMERVQSVTVKMNRPGASKYTVGSTIPVYYSPKHKRIYLEDWNGSTWSGYIVFLLVLLSLYKVADALSFLNYYVCRIRLGAAAFEKVEDTVGVDV